MSWLLRVALTILGLLGYGVSPDENSSSPDVPPDGNDSVPPEQRS